MSFLQSILNFNWAETFDTLLLLLSAFLLAFPLGLNRERRSRSAGIRTFPIVAMACCAFMTIGITQFSDPEPQSRIAYGIITGIGFIGGGAILKDKGSVSGTATAASIWSTGAIGLAVAFGMFEIAIALSLVNYLTLLMGAKLKHKSPIEESS